MLRVRCSAHLSPPGAPAATEPLTPEDWTAPGAIFGDVTALVAS
jgi:hypothetical protein